MDSQKRIGLALSGGGVRAIVFHLGILKCLAEYKLLESVAHVSTVSGGSLAIGLVYHYSRYNWPSSKQFFDIETKIKTLLTTKNLQISALTRFIKYPSELRNLFNRANVIANEIRDLWGIDGMFSQIPDSPIWSINGTTIESGKRWRFKKGKMGDYIVGYSNDFNLSLAEVIATSAAFPGGISPFCISTKNHKWFNYEKWGSEKVVPIEPIFKKLHIADGGIYDNLGLEPLYDQSTNSFKDNNINFIIISDASRPLIAKKRSMFHLKRLLRMIDILTNQIKSLRIRSISSFFIQQHSGLYFQIGQDYERIIKRAITYGKNVTANVKKEKNFLDEKLSKKAAMYPTTLKKIKKKDYELIFNNGYEVALANIKSYAPINI